MKQSTLPIVIATLAFVVTSSFGREPTPIGEQLIQPRAGRLAIVADGNSPDPDDIGATAVNFGLLKASGLSDRLVHLSHSCDLKPTNRIAAADELRRQKVMDRVCRDGVAHFGPFRNLTFDDLPRLEPNTTYFALSDRGWITLGGKPAVGLNDGAFWYRFRTGSN